MILFSRLFSIVVDLFKIKIKRAKELEYHHLVWIRIFDMIKTSILYSSVYDIAIYTVHELIHHDLYVNQSSLAKISYMLSFIVFLVTSFDMVRVFLVIKNFEVKKLLKVH